MRLTPTSILNMQAVANPHVPLPTNVYLQLSVSLREVTNNIALTDVGNTYRMIRLSSQKQRLVTRIHIERSRRRALAVKVGRRE